MINTIQKFITNRLKILFKSQNVITKPKVNEPMTTSQDVLGGVVAYNKYGGYFTPISSQQRPAVQKILNGDIYEPDTIQFMIDNCGIGDIIHAGTFFGDFLPGISSSLSDNRKIWAFEPNLENFRCAQITSLINNLKNVELFNSGLGDVKSTAKMLVELESGYKLGGASMILKEAEKGKTIDVEINSIDNIIPDNRLISIIQLDVEGYEKEALTGALETIRRCKPILILEDNNNIIETNWFAENILSIGYEINQKIHENTLLTVKELHNIV